MWKSKKSTSPFSHLPAPAPRVLHSLAPWTLHTFCPAPGSSCAPSSHRAALFGGLAVREVRAGALVLLCCGIWFSRTPFFSPHPSKWIKVAAAFRAMSRRERGEREPCRCSAVPSSFRGSQAKQAEAGSVVDGTRRGMPRGCRRGCWRPSRRCLSLWIRLAPVPPQSSPAVVPTHHPSHGPGPHCVGPG